MQTSKVITIGGLEKIFLDNDILSNYIAVVTSRNNKILTTNVFPSFSLMNLLIVY